MNVQKKIEFAVAGRDASIALQAAGKAVNAKDTAVQVGETLSTAVEQAQEFSDALEPALQEIGTATQNAVTATDNAVTATDNANDAAQNANDKANDLVGVADERIALKTVQTEFGEIEGYAHIFRLLTNEFIGGIKSTGEFDLKNIIAEVLKLPAEMKTAQDGSEIKIWKDADGNALMWIDGNGVLNIPYLSTLSEEHGTADLSEIKIWRDADGNALMWIDETGTVNIPHLKAPGLDPGVSDEVKELQDKVEALEMQSKSLLAASALTDRGDTGNDERAIAIVLRESGEYSVEADNVDARLPLFSFSDDDSNDRQISGNPTSIFDGGYMSRLHPVLASRQVPGSEAFIGEKLGFLQNPPVLTLTGVAHKRLVDKWGWEMINHTLTHRYDFAFEVADLAAADNLPGHPTAGGSFTSDAVRHVYSLDDEQNYYWAASQEWLRVPHDYIRPFVRDFDTNENIYDNPQFDMYRQQRYNQLTAERLGLGPVKTWCSPAGSHSKKTRDYVLQTHYGIVTGTGFNVGTGSRIIPPLCSSIRRFTLDGDNDPDVALTSWKAQVDLAIAENAWICFTTHSYYTEWANYKEDELVSNGGTYPDEWVMPIGDINTDPNNFDMPKAATGLSDWRGWFPCPNTRLHALWEFIGYIQEQGGKIVTPKDAIARIGNVVNVGDFTDGNKSPRAPFDDAKYPHYVVGVDGSARYFKP